MKLRADNTVCEGHGQCAMVDDELFTLDAPAAAVDARTKCR
jgi:ferredoxin